MSEKAASAQLMAVRGAVREAMADIGPGSTVLVACSGGPDSLALMGAAAWVGARHEVTVAAVVVDHGLQPGSADIAARAADTCMRLGAAWTEVATVVVGSAGGPEAAARRARYAALEHAAVAHDAAAVLLGHTRDDQAETVLLRLARGSGARSLAAMRPRSGPWRRPFLYLARSEVHLASDELLAPLADGAWIDPHNADRAFARVRVRSILAELERDLGVGVVLGLSRSADLLRDDADALDDWAGREVTRLVRRTPTGCEADCADLLLLPRAVRSRLIRRMCLDVGCPPDALDVDHVRRIEALLSDWRGQGPASLPGGVVARRAYGRLCLLSP